MKKVKLKLKNIIQTYEKKITLNNINLDIYQGELLAVLGPSGCGKTTLLKSIAGLIPINKGKIYIDNQSVEKSPPQERNAAMIFQNYALFPHMTVKENIEYGLKIRNEKIKIIKEKTDKIIDLIKLKGYENRSITSLSGGQQQRVAIGRALIVEPAVLLFDEPLSNLDENLRDEMRSEIKKILKSINITSIYVTHDQNEAMAIADRIVIMKNGMIEQISSPEDICYRPKNEYVARFIGHKNIFNTTIKDNHFSLLGKTFEYSNNIVNDSKIKVLIQSESIDIFHYKENNLLEDKNKYFYLEGKIIDEEKLVNIQKYLVKVEDELINITILNRYYKENFKKNDTVILRVNTESLHFLES